MTAASQATAAVHGTDDPTVSVIMIFRDAARFIGEAMESVIAQTWPHWELLLVDDGSQDSSRDIASGYRERMPERIRILEHPGHVNLGMSASRNLGLSSARGEYVAFLDADDVYLPTRLERHVELLGRWPEVGAIQGCVLYWHSWADEAAARRQDLPERPPPGLLGGLIDPPALLLLMLETRGSTVPGICSLTVRRPLLRAIGGSEEGFRAHYEDQVLFAKIYLSTPVIVIEDRLALYRQHPESLTAQADDGGDAPHRWHTGRQEFLRWLESWLRERLIEDDIVWTSLRAGQREHRPGLMVRVLRRSLAGLRCVAETVLPPSLSIALVEWWGRRKLALAALRSARTQSRISRQLDASRNSALPGERDRRDEGSPPPA
jgi:glycosyltransferase involved in cell wall biosynthesis